MLRRATGPDSAFADFVASHSASAQHLAFRITHDYQGAQDAVQTAYVRAFVQWGHICELADPAAYVQRMVVNSAIDWHRASRRRSAREWFSGNPPEAAVSDPGHQAVEDQSELMAILSCLSGQQRAVIVLRYAQDCTEKETAALLGIGVGSVKRHAARALIKLRQGSAGYSLGGVAHAS